MLFYITLSIYVSIYPSATSFTTRTRRKAAICITSKSPRLQKLDVRMMFDHGKPRVHAKRYEYVADPTIEYSYSGKTED